MPPKAGTKAQRAVNPKPHGPIIASACCIQGVYTKKIDASKRQIHRAGLWDLPRCWRKIIFPGQYSMASGKWENAATAKLKGKLLDRTYVPAKVQAE